MESDVVSTPKPPMRWRDIWLSAFLRPSVATFEQIAVTYETAIRQQVERTQKLAHTLRSREPGSLFEKLMLPILLWGSDRIVQDRGTQSVEDDVRRTLFLVCFVGAILTMIIALTVHFGLGLSFPDNSLLLANWRRADGIEPSLADMLFPAFLFSIGWAGISGQGLVIITTIRHFFARMIGYRGDADRYKLRYVSMAYFAPVALLMGVARTLPFVGVYMLALRAVYGVIVSTIAIKATYQFEWGRAILSNWVSIAGAGIVVILSSPLGEVAWAFVGYALRTGLR